MNDAAEMLEVAKEECGWLERELKEARGLLVIRADHAGRLADEVRELGAERDCLLAKLNAVNEWRIQWGRDTRRGMGREVLLGILTTSPAQSLANHDAALIVEYIDSPEHAESLREAAYGAWDQGKRTGGSRAMRMMSDE
ncbi:hypothetical protein [Cryobacterium sp. PH31-O1]|uniref:hypothetical protein n=1 Tax=Cryobacterium sp. PH31-O1 TaxID=3046306 RepID=UPI0024BAA290|nr:hypothetical protein [Cryobacterium sp. PH31-O1]MDJ0337448.1 hypothetical protein [Cryobacterium sp. PH31-O1]